MCLCGSEGRFGWAWLLKFRLCAFLTFIKSPASDENFEEIID